MWNVIFASTNSSHSSATDTSFVWKDNVTTCIVRQSHISFQAGVCTSECAFYQNKGQKKIGLCLFLTKSSHLSESVPLKHLTLHGLFRIAEIKQHPAYLRVSCGIVCSVCKTVGGWRKIHKSFKSKQQPKLNNERLFFFFCNQQAKSTNMFWFIYLVFKGKKIIDQNRINPSESCFKSQSVWFMTLCFGSFRAATFEKRACRHQPVSTVGVRT